MPEPRELDGNAIAGLLTEVFGHELTAQIGECAGCGARRPIAETDVYARGPGVVVRCRTCETALMVLVTVRAITCVDLRGLAELTLS